MSAYHAAAETVTPARAIVMLYDGAMKRLNEARNAILAGRIEERHLLVAKAYAIINGLHCQLDFEAGGDVARLLDRYYIYILHRMTFIDIKNDPEICDELIARLREMRASWAAIADGAGQAMPGNEPRIPETACLLT